MSSQPRDCSTGHSIPKAWHTLGAQQGSNKPRRKCLCFCLCCSGVCIFVLSPPLAWELLLPRTLSNAESQPEPHPVLDGMRGTAGDGGESARRGFDGAANVHRLRIQTAGLELQLCRLQAVTQGRTLNVRGPRPPHRDMVMGRKCMQMPGTVPGTQSA